MTNYIGFKTLNKRLSYLFNVIDDINPETDKKKSKNNSTLCMLRSFITKCGRLVKILPFIEDVPCNQNAAIVFLYFPAILKRRNDSYTNAHITHNLSHSK